MSGPANTTKLPEGAHFAAETLTLVCRASDCSASLQASTRERALNLAWALRLEASVELRREITRLGRVTGFGFGGWAIAAA